MPSHDHPEAENLGWSLTSSQMAYESKMVRLREDSLEVPGAGERKFAYMLRGAAVIIVPVTAEQEMILVRQYRYPVDEFCYEVPAGTALDVKDKSLEEVAAKELKEEIGATFQTLERIGSFYSNNAMMDEECHVFLALGVKRPDAPQPEPMEKIEIHQMPIGKAMHLVRSGQMKTGPSALAVLLCETRLKELGLA